ncbi:unnamed protein product [Ranitomeya imitator]|uniref:Phosphatidic acid phosphatase type 2/haloperoxidase domain-containing protein n=1 Tax=Ranitomeya imitator TaxID=111125 RepID=A0ABN9LTY2_9NEOB|nr:unnamed protein product [Ranitomeya imitator]
MDSTCLVPTVKHGGGGVMDNDPNHTSRLCKGYMTKKESDGVLRQMTWPPQSPDLNPIKMFPFVLGFVAAFCLSTLVSLSRLYTGMHTVLDVICGVLIALLFIAVTFPVWDFMDQLIMTNPICPVFAVIAAFLLSYNYPRLDHYSTTRADTTVMLSAGAGTCVGVWIINRIGLTYVPSGEFPLGIPPITYPMLIQHVLRFVLGVTLLVIVRFIAKTLSLKALGSWYKVSTQDILVRQRLEIEVPYKFVTYLSIGVVATSMVPWLYYLVGL